MFKCNECGKINKVGGIFCHSCGAKLDLHNVQPVKERTFKVGKLLRSLVSLAVFAAVIGAFVALFIPMKVEMDMPEEALKEKLWGALEHVLNDPMVSPGESYRLNSAGITYLARRMTALEKGMEDDASGVLAPQTVFVELMPRNLVLVLVRYSVFGKFTSDAVVVGRIGVENNSPTFEIVKAYIGRMPMPGPLQSVAVGRVLSQFQDRAELTGLNGKVESITTDRDELVFEPLPRKPETGARRPPPLSGGVEFGKGIDFGKGVDFGGN